MECVVHNRIKCKIYYKIKQVRKKCELVYKYRGKVVVILHFIGDGRKSKMKKG